MSSSAPKRSASSTELLFSDREERRDLGAASAQGAQRPRKEATAELGGRRPRREYESEARTRAGGALEDLLVHHLGAVYGGASFLDLPAPRSGVQACWEMLALSRNPELAMPGVPEPGEQPLAVAGRLLEGLYRLDWEAAALELWRARLEHAGAGARAGERAFRSRLDEGQDLGERQRVELRLGWAASLLDRGALREARRVLAPGSMERSARQDARLERLRFWTTLLAGDLRGARELAPERARVVRRGPRALQELAGHWPEAAALLEVPEGLGTTWGRGSCWSPWPRGEAPRSREEVGAQLLAVFAFGAGRRVELLHGDAAPGLAAKLDSWVADRRRACFDRGHPEHGLVIEATPRLLHGRQLPSALSSRSVALVLAPVHDAEGEVAGWVHLEWEHHLVPDTQRLTALAKAWRPRVLGVKGLGARSSWWGIDRVSEGRRDSRAWDARGSGRHRGPSLAEPARGLCTEVFAALVRELGLKLSQRRWWGFTHARGRTQLVATGGQGLTEPVASDEPAGRGRALDRCLGAGGVVRYEEADPRLSIHGASASGVVLPLVQAGRVVALLAIESSRRRDFRPRESERLAAVAARHALPMTLALFRAWHLQRFGYDLHFDADEPAFRELAAHLQAATRSRAPVVLSGPAGAGKRVVARWFHWDCGAAEDLELHPCGPEGVGGWSEEEFADRLERRGGCLILDGLGELPPERQAQLLAFLESELPRRSRDCDAGAARQLVVTSEGSLEQLALQGRLRPDLAAGASRFQVQLPALARRRRALVGFVTFFAARFAREQGCRPPEFEDGALALLWRQPWGGNLRELEGLLFKLVLLHPGAHVGPDELREVARRFQLELLEKLPPRRTSRAEIVQALRSTLKSSGGLNKRRAALYLGWDPDTLAARLEAFGLDDRNLEGEPDSWVP